MRIAKIRDSNLSGSCMLGASLEKADLSGSNLSNTNLRWAVFDGALLTNVNLKDADLRRADLRGARGITCDQLTKARNWAECFRDSALACGKPIPQPVEGKAVLIRQLIATGEIQ